MVGDLPLFTMWYYVAKRLIYFVPTIVLILLINFAILEWMPGGPVQYIHGVLSEASLDEGLPDVSGQVILPQELQDELEKQIGLEQPRWQRFLLLLKNYVTFDLGTSYRSGRCVRDMVLERLPNTLIVGVISFVLIYIFAIPVGLLLGYRRPGVMMRGVRIILMMLYAMPSVVLGMAMVLCFSTGYITNYFPSGGMCSLGLGDASLWKTIKDYAWHIFLPVLTVILSSFAAPMSLIESSVRTERKKKYAYAAYMRGLSNWDVLSKHVLKNSMVPLLGYMPGQLGSIILTKPLFVEIIFSFGGLGTLIFQAFESRDYAVIFGTLYIFSLMRVVLYLLGDVIVMLMDSRVSFEELRR